MINLQQWPCAPRCGQGQGLCLPSAIPTSDPGSVTAKPADIYLKHTNAGCAASVVRQSTPPLHSTKPAQSLNPHRSSCRARGFLHGRLSYASVRNPSPCRTLSARFSLLGCGPSAFRFRPDSEACEYRDAAPYSRPRTTLRGHGAALPVTLLFVRPEQAAVLRFRLCGRS